MNEYWFARRFPLGDPRGGMAPINWKGAAVVLGFVVVLLIGAGVWAYMAQDGRMVEGAAIFTVFAFCDGMWFTSTTRVHGDRVRTVADYRAEKKRA